MTASASGDGTALVLDNAVVDAKGYSGAGQDFSITATTDGNGAAIKTRGDSSLNNVALNGTTTGNGSAVVVSGTLATDKTITATAKGEDSSGAALVLDGGKLQSTAADNAPVDVTASAQGSGTAVKVSTGGDSALDNIALNASATAGEALNVQGTLNTQNAGISANVSGSGTALNVSGGTVHSAGNSTLTATADQGQAAVITDGRLTGDTEGALSVTATTGTDQPALNISGNSEVSNSAVSGENNGEGSAVTIAGTVSSSGGAEISGHTTNGTAITVADGASVTSTQPGGLVLNASADGDSGTGVVLGNATLTGSKVTADTTKGDAVQLTGGISPAVTLPDTP